MPSVADRVRVPRWCSYLRIILLRRNGPKELLSRGPLLAEFALANLKIALNGWNPTFLLPFISGNLVLFICGLDRCRLPLAT